MKAKEKESDRSRSDVYRESLVGTHTTLCSLSETLQTTALPSSALYLVSDTYVALHATRGYNGYLLAYFRIFLCASHTLRMRIPSIRMRVFRGVNHVVIFPTRKVAASDHVCYTTEVAALENTRVSNVRDSKRM